MKVQWQGQSLRLRIDEAELQHLRDGGEVENRSRLPLDDDCVQRLRLDGEGLAAMTGTVNDWCLVLPRAEVEAYVGRLPCKDGLGYDLAVAGGGALRIDVEVDVRDSARVRGKARR